MIVKQQINNWCLLYSSDDDIANQTLFQTVVDEKINIKKTLKDTNNSRVLQFEFNQQNLVVKYPVAKNKRKWIRLTTLWRQSEAKKAFLALYRLNQLDINAPKPILMAEKKYLGMVIDSFLCYHYVLGEKCNRVGKKSYGQIIQLIKQLHNNNLVHGDAHTANFNYDNETVTALDVKAKRIYFGKLSYIKDYLQLSYNDETIEKQFPKISNSFLYQTAKRINLIKDKFIKLRKKIKKLFIAKNSQSP